MSPYGLSHEPTAHLSLWFVLTVDHNLLSCERWTSVIPAGLVGMTVTNLWKDKHDLVPHLWWKNILTYERHLNLLGWHGYNVTTNIWGFFLSPIRFYCLLAFDFYCILMTIKTEKNMLYFGWLGFVVYLIRNVLCNHDTSIYGHSWFDIIREHLGNRTASLN